MKKKYKNVFNLSFQNDAAAYEVFVEFRVYTLVLVLFSAIVARRRSKKGLEHFGFVKLGERCNNTLEGLV